MTDWAVRRVAMAARAVRRAANYALERQNFTSVTKSFLSSKPVAVQVQILVTHSLKPWS